MLLKANQAENIFSLVTTKLALFLQKSKILSNFMFIELLVQELFHL